MDIIDKKRAEESLRAAHDELEQRVVERTRQLSAVNAELVNEIAERKRAEAELLALKDELAADLAAMTRLHELSSRLLTTTDLQPLLEEVLDATMALLNADFGNVQLYDPRTGALKIVAQRGFEQAFLDYFDSVHQGTASCGAAIQRRERVIVPDVLADPLFAKHLGIVASAGYRAVQSTPLFSRNGEMLGMISTHFRQPHRPSEREFGLIDLYAGQAAGMIERKRTEEQLRRNEGFLAEGQRISHTGSWAVKFATEDVFWSEEMYRIYGLDPATTKLSHMPFQRIHSEDWPYVHQAFERAIVGKTDFAIEHRAVMEDGSIKHLHALGHPVLNESGNVIEYIGIVLDITERRHAEEALHAVQAELARISRVMTMGELTASIAHEVNQPLAAIATNANAGLRWLAVETPDLDEVREALGRIIRDANRASNVITRIRALLWKTDIQDEPLDINETVQEMVTVMQAEIQRNGVSLQTVLAGDLPVVLGNQVQLQQVVLNLIMNGIESMSALTDRARELEIKTGKGEADTVRITVRDSGKGIDAQSLERIFEPFYTTKPQGMGMGLAISRSIIEAHSGHLWATRNDGPGMTFHFTLPIDGGKA